MNSLLMTKLNIPKNNKEIISRPRLQKKLDKIIKTKLTIVSAPAGYGKTSMISNWLENFDFKKVWISLDKKDNDPVIFLNYFITALKSLNSDIGKSIEGLINIPKLPEIGVLITSLINEISKINEKFIIVLDDFHVIENVKLKKAFQIILDNQIENMHFVILTREDPDIKISKLRLNGELLEFRARDLKFTKKEIKNFFEKSFNMKFSNEELEILNNRTEGWIASLKLISISLKDKKENEKKNFIRNFGGSHKHVIDYLFEEVIKHQEEKVYSFLCETSILDNLSTSLCNEITGRSDAEEIICYLEKTNIFLIPLDENGEWFRYHHLFQDYLQTELTKYKMRKLHKRAAKWHEKNENLMEASYHCIKGNMDKDDLKLIVKTVDSLILEGKITSVLILLEKVPDEYTEKSVELKIYQALVLFLSGNIPKAEFILMSIEEDPELENNKIVLGKLSFFKVIISITSGKKDFHKLAKKSEELLRDSDPIFYCGSLLALGWAESSKGKVKKAIVHFKKAYFTGKKTKQPFLEALALANMSITLIETGEIIKAKSYCEQGIKSFLNSSGEMLPIGKIINVALGMAYFEMNKLDKAKKCIEESLDILEKLGLIHMYGESKILLIAIFYNMGEKEKAMNVLQELYGMAKKIEFSYLIYKLDGIKNKIQFHEGDIKSTKDWIEKNNNMEDFEKKGGNKLYIKILIENRDYKKAKNLLNKLIERKELINHGRELPELYILKSILAKKEGNEDLETEFLKKAINLTAPENFYRPFLFYINDLNSSLKKIKSLAPDFINALLNMSSLNSKKDANESLIEPLTERELEILELIAKGNTNKKIAKELFITVGTTKWHLHNIYGKLGVRKRIQAVNKAKELNIIEG
ncbi:MAG: LuxR C-terminal-related transcriptional regulator [Fusobacteriota bacterium]